MIGVTHSHGNNLSAFFKIKDKLRNRHLRRHVLSSSQCRPQITRNANTDTTSHILRKEIERLERKVIALEKKHNNEADFKKISQKQQRQLYDSFKLLREKYDDLRAEMHHILWEYIPSKQSGIGSFQELIEVDHAIFETVDQISDYAIGSLLGEGHFADVKLCKHLVTQKQLAVKIMPKQKITTLACLQRVQTEIYLLKKLKHPNIVAFADFINSPTCLYLISEVFGKDLFEFFNANPNGVTNDVARQIGLGIAKPLLFLHSSGICHRDLKPENILLSENKDGSPLSQHNIQICDFGESVIGVSRHERGLSDLCGSPGFFAPEMIMGEGGKYNGFAADVWSIGCIMLELTRGHDYFRRVWMSSYDSDILQDNDEFEKSLKTAVMAVNEIREVHNDDFVKEEKLAHFLQEVLTIDPEQRIDSSAILSHPWFCIDNNASLIIGQEKQNGCNNSVTTKTNISKRRKRSMNLRHSLNIRPRKHSVCKYGTDSKIIPTDVDRLCHGIASECTREINANDLLPVEVPCAHT